MYKTDKVLFRNIPFLSSLYSNYLIYMERLLLSYLLSTFLFFIVSCQEIEEITQADEPDLIEFIA